MHMGDKDCINIIIGKNELTADLVNLHNGDLFSPVKSTLLKAIKNGHFVSWSGFIEKLVNKHLTPSIATANGHQHQEPQQLQSTKPSDWT